LQLDVEHQFLLENTDFIEFVYRYQIFDIVNLLVTEFQLQLPLLAAGEVLDSGSTLDSETSTITPNFAGYEGPNLRYRATFMGIAPLVPGFSSDVLFIRTTTGPDLDRGDLAGFIFGDGAFASNMQITGPGTTVTLSAQDAQTPTPEPSTLILLGSGLLALVGARFRRRRK